MTLPAAEERATGGFVTGHDFGRPDKLSVFVPLSGLQLAKGFAVFEQYRLLRVTPSPPKIILITKDLSQSPVK